MANKKRTAEKNNRGPAIAPAGSSDRQPSIGARCTDPIGDEDVPARINPPAQPLSALRLLLGVARNPIETWPADVYRQPLFQSSVVGHRYAFVSSPDLIRRVLLDDADAFDKGVVARRALQPALGEAILTSDGAKWRWQRRAVAPLFRQDNIRRVLPLMIQCAERTRERWRSHRAGTEIDVAREMMRTTFDIALEAMLPGRHRIDPPLMEQAVTDYLESTSWLIMLTMIGAPAWTPHPGFRKARRAVRYLKQVLADLIAEARRSPGHRGDLLSLLIEAKDHETGRQMSDDEIRDNLLTFITAGHETSAVALTWTLYLLSRHHCVEARLRHEIDEVTAGARVTADHVDRLLYSKQVIQEAMRLYPPAPVIAREARRDIVLADQKIRSGTVVYVPLYAVHRHELLWDHPDLFEPGRFAPDIVKDRDRFAYLPFGAGPRICIGAGFAMAEMVAILAVLLSAFRLRLRPGYIPRLKMRITLRPDRGMPMSLVPLDDCVSTRSL